jgi:hypothetical protein
MKVLYVVSHNIAGYMPESDPIVCETMEDALEAMAEAMHEASANVPQDAPDPFGEHWAQDLYHEAENVPTGTVPEYHTSVETGRGPYHLDQWWHCQPVELTDEQAEDLLNGD